MAQQTADYRDVNETLYKRWQDISDDDPNANVKRARIGDDLIRANSRLLFKAISRFTRVNHDGQDDLYAAASAALWRAFQMWDPTKGTLGTFSRAYINGDVQREVARQEYPHLTYDDFTHRGRLVKLQREHVAQHGTELTAQQLSEATGMNVDKVHRLLAAKPVSMDVTVGGPEGRSFGELLAEKVAAPDDEPPLEDDITPDMARTIDSFDLTLHLLSTGGGLLPSPMATPVVSVLTGAPRRSISSVNDRVQLDLLAHRIEEITSQPVTAAVLARAAGVPLLRAAEHLYPYVSSKTNRRITR